MIFWLTGDSGSGKSTLAKKLINDKTVWLDADVVRPAICEDLGFSPEDRIKNNLRIARLAKVIHDQGFDVMVSTICPNKELKQQVYWICKCRFISMDGIFEAVNS